MISFSSSSKAELLHSSSHKRGSLLKYHVRYAVAAARIASRTVDADDVCRRAVALYKWAQKKQT